MTHNENIVLSRTGGFGGSDANLFYKIGTKGLKSLSNTEKKRIRVAKGLDEYKGFGGNEATQKGHDFEDWWEKQMSLEKDIYFEREPKLSKQLATNFETFFHADFFYSSAIASDIEELKCTEHPEKAIDEYYNQLQWQHLISDCGVLMLITCDSKAATFEDGLQPSKYVTRDEKRIKILLKGVQLLDEAWETIDLELGDEWGLAELTTMEANAIKALDNELRQIKLHEEKANEIKSQLLEIMEANGVQSIDGGTYKITYIGASTSKSFDKKALEKAHPEIDLTKFEKKTDKKSYIKITLK